MSWRRIGVLVEHLPPGSATWVAIHGQAALWTTTHELLATLIDVTNAQTAALIKMWGGTGSNPQRLPRPTAAGGDAEPERGTRVARLASASELADFIGLTNKEA